jgi:DNA-binding SARP family transcriptional activator
MELRLLGEVELWAADQLLDVGAPRLQAVLVALAVDAGRPVAIETLIGRVWGDTPPVEVRNVLYSYLSRIRRLLRQASTITGETAVRIERRHAGYALDIEPDLVDLHRFQRLVEQGSDRRCGDDAQADALAEALALWRGTPLAGLPGEWAAQVRDSWSRRRLDAVVQWAQVELRIGRPAAVITTLPDLAAEYPLVEPLETLLMRALCAAGRSAEALERYSAVRRRLADELGTDPGPELRGLHQAVLHGELPPPPPDPVIAAVRTPTPASRKPPPASNSVVAQHRPDRAPADGNASRTVPPDDRPPAPDHAAINPDPTGKPQPVETSSVPIDAVATDTPPSQAQSRLTPRLTVLAALTAVILLAAIGSLFIFHRDNGEDAPSLSPSVERAQVLFATAEEFDQDGRAKDAQATIIDAMHLYDKLIKLNPDQNAPPLAPAIIQALGRAGVDFSVAEASLRTWLANPVFTPYPAISQVLLLRGWRLKAPVFLDVIVSNYEQAPGITSPRTVADVRPDVLKAAILEGSNARHGTQITDFEQLLKP